MTSITITAADESIVYGFGPMPGTVLLDSFPGASDDDRLTAALAYAQAQPFIPTILLGGRAYVFTRTQNTFSGMRLSGPTVGWQNPELSGGKFTPCRVTLNVGSGANSWLVGTATNFDGYVGNLSFVSGNGASQFFHHPLANGTAYCWTFHSLSFLGFKNVMGNATDGAALTCCTISGQWTIVGGLDTQIHVQGSDSDFWTDGSCNIGPDSNGNGGGKFLAVFTSMGKTNVGGMYFTADAGWRALLIQGSPNYGPGLTFSGMRIEGRNPNDPSYGALVRVQSSNVMFRDTWIAYAMSNPGAYTDAIDKGVVHVTGGDAIFDGVTYDRAANVGQDVPLFRVEAGAALEVAHVRTCSRGGGWSALPVVSGAASVDRSVLLTI